MNAQIDQLVRSIFQKDSLDQCSVQELEQYADRHPYFGAAQLLLTKKLQTENPDRYNEQLQKTFLFFHNPLWVEHLLNDSGKAQIVKAKPADSYTPSENGQTATAPTESVEEVVISAPELQQPVIVETIEEPEEEIMEPVVEETNPVPLPELKIMPVDTSKTEVLFQPYHTVDYFASQGIKYKEEEKPTDKFGQQLKSFTDWIKSMKRLPETEISRQVDAGAEHKVEQMAQHSLEDKEVNTEAMAEVWEKQGNTLKAIDIYLKLSLLDPSKSTYFAAKIEELKKLN